MKKPHEIAAEMSPERIRFLQSILIDPYSEPVCEACGGAGRRTYSNTGTWRRTSGSFCGQSITRDVCDQCWGSGVSDAPGVNLKELYGDLQIARLERDAEKKMRDEAFAENTRLRAQNESLTKLTVNSPHVHHYGSTTSLCQCGAVDPAQPELKAYLERTGR